MLTGKTKNLAVIGYPIAHSLSPLIHNAALREAALDYVYIALPIQPSKLREAVAGIRAIGLSGFNVTIPHKTAIMELLDEIDEGARVIGAVNTVVAENGRLKGYNTDCSGFISSVLAKGIELSGKRAVLIGAGGAASAVLWGFIKSGVQELTLAVRNPLKAQTVADKFSSYFPVKIVDWETAAYQTALASCDILVNCTPLGMAPHTDACPKVDWEKLPRSAAVCDLIYTPAETKFLAAARQLGHVTLNGEGMLLRQGAAAFQLWTGHEPNIEVMQRALSSALNNRR